MTSGATEFREKVRQSLENPQPLPRLHAWLEPLGVGSHVLITGVMPNGATGRAPGGCYECLFGRDAQGALINRAALAAPGQSFLRTMTGCAGSFAPFSALDAVRTATEAVALAGAVLRGALASPLLVTWRGAADDFEKNGFQLSARGRALAHGAREQRADFADAACAQCGRRAYA